MLRWAKRLAVVAALVGAAAVLTQSAIRPVSTLMLARWLTGERVERRWVPLSTVAPALVASVVMSEDGQFCREHGVDFGALREVVSDGEPTRGASTITMQLVKNLFLWPGRSYLRKALEIPLALVLDRIWGKRRIMEAYLNVAEWGPGGIFGVEAAARRDFGLSAAALAPRQAALLATALPNPILRDPRRPSRRHRLLARRILDMQAIAGPHVACLH